MAYSKKTTAKSKPARNSRSMKNKMAMSSTPKKKPAKKKSPSKSAMNYGQDMKKTKRANGKKA